MFLNGSCLLIFYFQTSFNIHVRFCVYQCRNEESEVPIQCKNVSTA